ncbi:hypothetical protein [Aureivirga sp. CE67]|uniref:hypothetical protein n=1 Tax=Aureivirga sp. CE67 TaxID=1788983 RepID=UPI0018C9F3BC|nr:hypothetical protein [Aureivirga sp. CE67]
MKKLYIVIIIILCSLSSCKNSENYEEIKISPIVKNIDSLEMWEYNFQTETENNDNYGVLEFKRKEKIEKENEVLIPSISFDIYPLALFDSISKFETNRLMALSCCYPKCGATVESIGNFVLWSDPFSITSSFECNGIDYTRGNVREIFKILKQHKNKTIEELLENLPIDKRKD